MSERMVKTCDACGNEITKKSLSTRVRLHDYRRYADGYSAFPFIEFDLCGGCLPQPKELTKAKWSDVLIIFKRLLSKLTNESV